MSYLSGTIGTFNGKNIVATPWDTQPGVTAPSSIEWDAQESVAVNESPFTFQTQTYDWMCSILDGEVSFPAMNRYSYDAINAFIMSCRGPVNCFMMGDPKAAIPKGTAVGSPLVNGASQTGYQLVTDGWQWPNPLTNPSFLQGSTGWTPQTGWSVVTGIGGPSGEQYVAKYVGPGTAAIVNSAQIPCSPGNTLTASCMGIGFVGATGFACLRINCWTFANTLLSTTVSNFAVANGNWQAQSVTVNAPPLTAYFTIDYAVSSSTSSTAWCFSEVNACNPTVTTYGVLLPGDYIQVGVRMYRVTASVSCDGYGNATIPVWPNIRDLPADGANIQTRNCKGLFRLVGSSGNKSSVTPGSYGVSPLRIREAL